MVYKDRSIIWECCMYTEYMYIEECKEYCSIISVLTKSDTNIIHATTAGQAPAAKWWDVQVSQFHQDSLNLNGDWAKCFSYSMSWTYIPRAKPAVCVCVSYIPSMSVALLSISGHIYQHARQLRNHTAEFTQADRVCMGSNWDNTEV